MRQGDRGGEILVVGTPKTVAEHPRSYTGQFLKPVLQQYASAVRTA